MASGEIDGPTSHHYVKSKLLLKLVYLFNQLRERDGLGHIYAIFISHKLRALFKDTKNGKNLENIFKFFFHLNITCNGFKFTTAKNITLKI